MAFQRPRSPTLAPSEAQLEHLEVFAQRATAKSVTHRVTRYIGRARSTTSRK